MTYSLVNDGILISLLSSPHNWVVFHPLHTPKQPGPFFHSFIYSTLLETNMTLENPQVQ